VSAIAWEEGTGFFDRLWRTVAPATTDPIATFGKLGSEMGAAPDLLVSTRFAIVVSAIGWSPLILFAPCLALLPIFFAAAVPEELRAIGAGAACAIVGLLPFVLLLGSVAVEVVHGFVFHGLARLLGGKGLLVQSLHAMLYTSAVRFWQAPAMLLGFVPFLGPTVQVLMRGAFLVWTGVACFGAAKSIHQLPDDRAALVAIGTALFSTAVVVAVLVLCVAAFVAAFFGSMSLDHVLPGSR
jgi:hypothetical protein